MKIVRGILTALGVLALAIVLGFVFGIVVMWLWNWLMPALFGLKMITYWQAVGLIILARLLFGSFGHGNNSKQECKSRAQKNRENEQAKCEDYLAWWQAEGQQAFDTYLTRKSQPTGDQETPDAE